MGVCAMACIEMLALSNVRSLPSVLLRSLVVTHLRGVVAFDHLD